MKPNTLASRVRSLRKQKCLTQQDLAAMCCCSVSAIQKIEGGQSGGSSLLVRVLADALGTTESKLLEEKAGRS
jgi:transcriptional regulator with XRE-family HTH domain